MEPKQMGLFIKALRKEKDLTQEQLAEKLFVSPKTVSRWETGSTLPDLTMLQNIADYFEVDIRELIDGERFSESKQASDGPAEQEKVRKMTEYSEKKEKRISRKMWLIFALILAAAGAAAAILILKKKNDELDRQQSYYVTGDAVRYIPTDEGQIQICLLSEQVRIVRVLIGPDTRIDEALKERIDRQETGLRIQALCAFTAREEKTAAKKDEDFAYPAVTISPAGSLPLSDPEWSPETPRTSLLELREGYTEKEAERDGCVVMLGVQMLHGELRWLEFLARVREGKAGVIRVWQGSGGSEYRLAELMFDGVRYWLSMWDRSGDTGEWSLVQESYQYLNEDVTGSYEKQSKGYLLTDSPDETMSGFMSKALSSYYDPNDTRYRHCVPFLYWDISDLPELETMVYGCETADLDDDGQEEKYYLLYGRTSGIFSFSIVVYGKDKGLLCQRIFSGEYMKLSLSKENGRLYVDGLQPDLNGSAVQQHRFKIVLRDGRPELPGSEAYWK